MGLLEFLFDLILDLIEEGCFYLIRKYVKNRFLRGVLYVLTVIAIIALAFALIIGAVYLGCEAVIWILDRIEGVLQ